MHICILLHHPIHGCYRRLRLLRMQRLSIKGTRHHREIMESGCSDADISLHSFGSCHLLEQLSCQNKDVWISSAPLSLLAFDTMEFKEIMQMSILVL